MYFCGIDIGTQSVKIILVNSIGKVFHEFSQALPKSNFYQNSQGYSCHEQNPEDWWAAVRMGLTNLAIFIQKSNIEPTNLAGIAISGTSGTIVLVDEKNNPLTPALMYNDNRAIEEAQHLNSIGGEHCLKHGYKFSASFALPKLVWLKGHNGIIWEKTHMVMHCVDYIVMKLSNSVGVSDYSNALKTGYDLLDLKWPEFLFDDLQIDRSILPEIKVPGELISHTSAELQKNTGFPANIPIFAGMTDSTASLLSSGAVNSGDLFSVLGSTIVEKAITDDIVRDPQQRLYSHRLPFGGWIPGGAGNSGALVLNEVFGKDNLAALDQKVAKYLPTDIYIYPLIYPGERFPFQHAAFTGFEHGKYQNKGQKYAAYLEGLCYVERMMIEVLTDLGVKMGNSIYTVGGATRATPWMQLRATILNKEVLIPKIPEAAFGCALLVGSVTEFGCDINRTCRELIQIKDKYHPQADLVPIYEKKFFEFKEILNNERKKIFHAN